ncbi:MAG: lipopolysaccharide biosynthesis protein, partial [Candidatus Acidiferrales bacterium]
EQQRLQELVRTYQARVLMSPAVEQEYKELTRGYNIALAFYNDLLGKKTQAEISVKMETAQQGEQFRVLDAANLPTSPSFPDRLLFAGGGLGGGLALGLGIVLLLEMKDKAMRNELDVEFFLELPALAHVPSVGAQHDGRWFGKQTAEYARQDART